MFIVLCDDDNSVCQILDKDVIFDGKHPPNEGDNVRFLWSGTEYTGEVLLHSDDLNLVNRRYEALKKNKSKQSKAKGSTSNTQLKKRSHSSPQSAGNIKEKGLSQCKKQKYLKHDRPSKENSKKGIEATQSFIENEIADKNNKKQTDAEEKCSPSKEKLKKMLQDAEEKIASLASAGVSRPQTCKISKPSTSSAKIAHKQKKKIVLEDSYTTTEGESDDEPEDSSHNKSSESDRESIENETNNNLEMKNEKNEGFVHGKKKKSENEGNEPAQADFGLSDSNDLFGKDWSGDKMVKLVDQVYCKDSELKPALAMASQASHLARRLIVGVFKPSGYLNCTFTGQAARAHQNKPGNNQLVKPLNEIAKNEILNFAMMRAEKKGWKNKDGLPQTEKEIRHAMSQKIGELKRKHEANEKIAQKNKS